MNHHFRTSSGCQHGAPHRGRAGKRSLFKLARTLYRNPGVRRGRNHNHWLPYSAPEENEELLVRNEYLVAENVILKSKIKKPVRFTDDERIRLAKIGKRMGRKALENVACIVKPETILKWFRKLVAEKFDGSKSRKKFGRRPEGIGRDYG
ncbi:MAG: hypothetical protein GY866_12205 [Proteobacteria bacterium]|nr:hypothetical protein [Pseudomonadota bacterium]